MLTKLIEVGRVISKANEAKLKAAMQSIMDILAKVTNATEAAQTLSYADISKELFCATKEKLDAAEGYYLWIADVFPTTYVYSFKGDLYQASYVVNADNSVTIGEPVEVTAQVVYTPDQEQPMSESTADIVPLASLDLREASVNLKLIKPGWGSSAYYPDAVLRRDGPGVFPAGTKMYWNHQTPAEEAQRPEGDLRDLAAELITAARWEAQGPEGPGLYAKAKVFEQYRAPLQDLKDSIGVSIRAMGLSKQGERENRTGPVLERLISAKSVDFVTVPGAGGKVLEMFEAARGSSSKNQKETEKMTAEELKVLNEARAAADKATTLSEALLQRLQLTEAREQARGIARATLATVNVHEAMRNRIIDRVVGEMPLKEGQLDTVAFSETVKAALATEQAYLESLGVGGIRGLGASGTKPAPEVTESDLTESFKALGMSAEAAALAAAGREGVN